MVLPNLLNQFRVEHRYHALLEWITKQEIQHGMVVYEAMCDASVWTQRCVRQADVVFVIGRGENDAELR